MKLLSTLALALLVLACSRDRVEQTPQPTPPPATPAPPAVNGPKLAFVDEAPRDASLVGYRDRLLAAVRARDVKAVADMADPNIRTSFGGGGGRAELEKMLPDVWTELEQLLTLGGTFRGEGEQQSFWAPYVYSAFPDEHDAFASLAVVADDVPLREAPNAQSKAVATLSRDIVQRAEPGEAQGEWTQVKTADGKTGYVEKKLVRSPVGYRAGFNKTADGWRMTALVAGD